MIAKSLLAALSHTRRRAECAEGHVARLTWTCQSKIAVALIMRDFRGQGRPKIFKAFSDSLDSFSCRPLAHELVHFAANGTGNVAMGTLGKQPA